MFTGFLALCADATRADNPIVALAARVVAEEPQDVRRSEVTETWVPTWIAARVMTIAGGVILTLITFILAFMISLATLAYPLPEVLILSWIFTQLIGLHRVPYFGWLAAVDVERQVYQKLGTGTASFYGLGVGLSYLLLLLWGAGMLALGWSSFVDEWDSLTNIAAWRFAFTSSELLALQFFPVIRAFSMSIVAIHWMAYWILSILRLPAVASVVLPDRSADTGPTYRRLEGLTLPGSLLFVLFALYLRFNEIVYNQSVIVLYVVILVFFSAFVVNAWVFYRAIWADLTPQQAHNEERIVRGAAGIQAGSISLLLGFIRIRNGYLR